MTLTCLKWWGQFVLLVTYAWFMNAVGFFPGALMGVIITFAEIGFSNIEDPYRPMEIR
jgi:hypothetical protein